MKLKELVKKVICDYINNECHIIDEAEFRIYAEIDNHLERLRAVAQFCSLLPGVKVEEIIEDMAEIFNDIDDVEIDVEQRKKEFVGTFEEFCEEIAKKNNKTIK